ncbi:hypothetical protein BGZ94_006163, partial [Podila epigama]
MLYNKLEDLTSAYKVRPMDAYLDSNEGVHSDQLQQENKSKEKKPKRKVKGTHVAGIVGGERYGVAKGARILAVKVLDARGQGSTSQVLAGIHYVIKHAIENPNTKKVINMSLGGAYSRPVNDAVRVAVNRFRLPFFVAAGNSGDDACQYSPAGVEEAFAVGGSNVGDEVGWYSCTGPCVNIFAPGTSIISDWINGRNGEHKLDGTSMATPHVAGVAALFLGA